MELIMGGAYQGKLQYALEHCGVDPQRVSACTKAEPDWHAPCINGLETVTLWCAETGQDPVALFEAHREAWKDSVLIIAEIGNGVVPMDPTLRQWREENGRLTKFLAREAESVTRVFCGLPQVLKP